MVRSRKVFNILFDVFQEVKGITFATAFMVALTIFILARDDASKLHIDAYASYYVTDTTSAKKEVEVEEEKTEEVSFEISKETTPAITEAFQENNVMKFLEVASKSSEDDTLNVLSLNDNNEPHVYTSSRPINEIIAEINSKMDISGTSGISRDDFIFAMENCESDTSGIMGMISGEIWDICEMYNLNEFAFSGKIAIESWWSNPEKSTLVAEKKNLLSIKDNKGEYKEYQTYVECVEDGARLLSEEYLDEDGRYATGGNLTKIGEVYCPETPEWPIQVASCARTIAETLLDDEKEE